MLPKSKDVRDNDQKSYRGVVSPENFLLVHAIRGPTVSLACFSGTEEQKPEHSRLERIGQDREAKRGNDSFQFYPNTEF